MILVRDDAKIMILTVVKSKTLENQTHDETTDAEQRTNVGNIEPKEQGATARVSGVVPHGMRRGESKALFSLPPSPSCPTSE